MILDWLLITAFIAGTPRDADHVILPDGGWRVVQIRSGGIAGIDERVEINSFGDRLRYSRGTRITCDGPVAAAAVRALDDAVRAVRAARVVTDDELSSAAGRVSDSMTETIVVERFRGTDVEVLHFAGATAMPDGTLASAHAVIDAMHGIPRCGETAPIR